jgi:hypothetical protein
MHPHVLEALNEGLDEVEKAQPALRSGATKAGNDTLHTFSSESKCPGIVNLVPLGDQFQGRKELLGNGGAFVREHREKSKDLLGGRRRFYAGDLR